METLDVLGRAFGSWVVTATLWTAVLLVGALVADRLLRRFVSPTGRMLLFAVVFARLALPGDFATPLGFAPAIEHATLTLPEPSAPVVEAPSLGTTTTMPAGSSEVPWGILVLSVYAIGVVVLAIAFGVAHRRLRNDVVRHGRDRELPDGAPVLEHDCIGPLALAGRVVIPRVLFEQLDPRELQAIARHERAHLRHRDPVLVVTLAALCILAWPVLPIWIAAARIRFLMELRADAAAVHGLDATGRNAYRKVMLRVAAIGWRTPALAAGFGPVAALEARLGALSSAPKGPLWVQVGTTAILGAAFLCCAARGESEVDDETDAAAIASTHTEIERTLPPCTVPVLGADQEPTDPKLVAASARLRSELTGADPESVEAVSRRVLDEADRLGLRRVRAEARVVLARHLAARQAYDEAQQQLEDAAWDAASSSHDGIAAVATSELVAVLLTKGDPDGAFAWKRHHDAAHRRIAGDAPLPGDASMLRALIAHHEAAGDHDEARELQSRLAHVLATCR